MSEEIKCPVCGEMFIKGRYKKYCSTKCRKKDYNQRFKIKLYFQCEYCGIGFKEGRENPYCSEECKNKHSNKQTKKRGRKKKVLSLAEINQRARAEGLTYGQYIVKYGGECK